MTRHNRVVTSRHQQDPHAQARAAVTAQRGYRSIREVSEGSGVTNSTWGNFENGKSGLTRNIRLAVMRAYGWPHDWPENLPPITAPVRASTSLEDGVIGLAVRIDALLVEIDRLRSGADERWMEADERHRLLADRVEVLERLSAVPPVRRGAGRSKPKSG